MASPRRLTDALVTQGTPTATAKDSSSKKKEEPPPELTPLEKMLQNAGPVRTDGTDKFFGLENVRQIQPSDPPLAAPPSNGPTGTWLIVLTVWKHMVRRERDPVRVPRQELTQALRIATAIPSYKRYSTRRPSATTS